MHDFQIQLNDNETQIKPNQGQIQPSEAQIQPKRHKNNPMRIVIYHPNIHFTDSSFLPKYLNVYFHDLRGSTSLAVVFTSIAIVTACELMI